MLPIYRNEKFTLTAVKAQKILAQYGTEITLDDAEIMLETLRKLCKLYVSEVFKNTTANQSQALLEGNV